MPFRVTCATCGETLDRDQFSKSQLINKSDGQRRCRQCVVRVILVHEHSHAPPAAHVVLLDLENLAFLATSLQPFVIALQMHGVAYEAYAAQDNGQANRATVVVESSDKEAVDVKMVWDASRLAKVGTKVLVVTKDLFGRTLASVEPASVEHATWDSPLPAFYQDCFGGARTLKEFGARHEIFEERKERSYAGSRSSRRSWSRPLTAPTTAYSTGAALRRRDSSARLSRTASQRSASPRRVTPRARDAETGYVSYYDARKRFGFIRPLRGGAHVFFHGSKVRGGMRAAAELARKQVVAFRRVPSRKYSGKFNAHDVAAC